MIERKDTLEGIRANTDYILPFEALTTIYERNQVLLLFFSPYLFLSLSVSLRLSLSFSLSLSVSVCLRLSLSLSLSLYLAVFFSISHPCSLPLFFSPSIPLSLTPLHHHHYITTARNSPKSLKEYAWKCIFSFPFKKESSL